MARRARHEPEWSGPLTFPFGRFRGFELAEIPSGYLVWALTIARPPLRAAIEDELARRARTTSDDGLAPARPPEELAPSIRAIVRSGHRACALAAHPDRGGSHGAMVTLNAAREWLEAFVGS